MDSLTQIVLGASVGQAVIGKKAGNTAMLWGAIAGTIPDLDVFARSFMSDVAAMDIHRGIMHSIPFALMASPILAKGLKKWYNHLNVSYLEWILLLFLGLFTHALLDCFTTWGTQLFWPLEYRVAWQSIFVIDPLYTLPFLGLLLVLMFYKKTNPIRVKLNTLALVISCAYLSFSLVAKFSANRVFQEAFEKSKYEVLEFSSRPAPLNTVLWTANAKLKDGFCIAHYSFFDENIPSEFLYIPKNEYLLEPYKNEEEVATLQRITKGYYSMKQSGDTLIMRDLRFGQMGYKDADAPFVFSYLFYEKNGKLHISQQANSFKNAGSIFSELWQRIKGI